MTDSHTTQQRLIRVSSIVTMDEQRRVINGGGILVRGAEIEALLSADEVKALRHFSGEAEDASRLTAVPGFIQTHIHLCQTLFRGLADDLGLLDWLKLKIFPLEAAHDAQSMRASALAGLTELIRSGTTTIMDMGSIHHEEEIVRAISESGLRAFVGKALMDLNPSYPALKESAADALSSATKQVEAWHGSSGGRIMYAVAPRFVLSCSDRLLQGAHELAESQKGVLFHTHAAEHRSEMDAVRERCGMGNIEFFEQQGLLSARTCLAHCIWLSPAEVDLLARRRAKVLHCPTSNLKLGSGVADIPAMRGKGITVSLGADGAPCNNSLNIFQEMKLAAIIQKPAHGPEAMSARSVMEMATVNGAETLGMMNTIGSLEKGKKADIVFLDLGRVWNPPRGTDDVYSSIVYSCGPENVRSVMVDGKWLYRDGQHLTIDEALAAETASAELRRLLMRVNSYA